MTMQLLTAAVDLDHTFGGDLSVSRNGDLLQASGLTRSQQRILRRLLTNPGDYLWQPAYGAGLRAAIGSTLTSSTLIGTVRAQLALESSVAQHPAPVISVQPLFNCLNMSIQYTDTESGPTTLSFDVSE